MCKYSFRYHLKSKYNMDVYDSYCVRFNTITTHYIALFAFLFQYNKNIGKFVLYVGHLMMLHNINFMLSVWFTEFSLVYFKLYIKNVTFGQTNGRVSWWSLERLLASAATSFFPDCVEQKLSAICSTLSLFGFRLVAAILYVVKLIRYLSVL